MILYYREEERRERGASATTLSAVRRPLVYGRATLHLIYRRLHLGSLFFLFSFFSCLTLSVLHSLCHRLFVSFGVLPAIITVAAFLFGAILFIGRGLIFSFF